MSASLTGVLRSRNSRHRQLPRGALCARLGGVERQARLFDIFARACGKHDVGVERRVPARQVAALNLGVLRKAGLADALLGEGKLFERRREGVLACSSVLLVQQLAAGERGARNGVGERLGLRLGRGRGRQGGLSLGGRSGGREKLDFLADGAAEVAEGFIDVAGVIVGFGRVLVASSRKSHMLAGCLLLLVVCCRCHVTVYMFIYETYVTASIFWWTCLRASTRFSRSM